MKKIEPVLIIHGGAWDIPPDMHDAHKTGIKNALDIGIKMLREGSDAMKVVIEVTKYLESDATFDAGVGSFLNAAGEVEMDAGLMHGNDLSVGAVAAIQNVEHPVEVAELIREKTQHALLVGEGASRFAFEHGFKKVPTEALLVGRERKLYENLRKKKQVRIKSFFEEKSLPGDTVGAVVYDHKGDIVAGTSTGGTPFKVAGRVGDSPLAGAGFFADNRLGGASCTGWGEGIIRVQLARSSVELLHESSPGQAAATAIERMQNDVGGNGGVIMINSLGEWDYYHNTPYMAVGAADRENILHLSMGIH